LQRRICSRWLALPLLVLVQAPAWAEPIQADRPGQSDPAYVVPKGTWQIELGGTFERTSGRVATWDAPEPLLRYGVLESVELRLSADGWIGSHERGSETENAGSDLELSTKVRLWEQQRWLPATSVLAGLSFPTGGRPVTSDGTDPFGKFIASWELGEPFTLGANLGMAGPTQGVADRRRVFELFAAASLGISLTERTGAFLEYYVTVRGRGRRDEHAVDGGFTYLLSDDVQLDISGGAGLNREAPDFFVGPGIAWRFRSP
jgi:hypothetical protein